VTHGPDGAVLSEARYGYGPDGERVRAEVDGDVTWTVFDRRNPALVLAADGSVRARRLYGDRLDAVLAEERDGANRWFLTDHLGTVRDLVGDDGVVIEHYVYDAFGALLSPLTSSVGNELFFTARPYDPVTGLVDLRRRAYDPTLGRFLQEDPLPPWGYGYAEGSPLLYVDPTGELSAIEYAKLLTFVGLLCDIYSAVSAGRGFIAFMMSVYQPILDALSGYPPGSTQFTPPMNLYSLIPCGLGDFIQPLVE